MQGLYAPVHVRVSVLSLCRPFDDDQGFHQCGSNYAVATAPKSLSHSGDPGARDRRRQHVHFIRAPARFPRTIISFTWSRIAAAQTATGSSRIHSIVVISLGGIFFVSIVRSCCSSTCVRLRSSSRFVFSQSSLPRIRPRPEVAYSASRSTRLLN